MDFRYKRKYFSIQDCYGILEIDEKKYVSIRKNDMHSIPKVLNQQNGKYVLKMKERVDFEKRLFKCV